MSFERVARELEAARLRQRDEHSRREAARPGLARLDALVAELEEEVERRTEFLPPSLLARARSYLESTRLDTGQSFPPRRRPGLVLDQVFEAASLVRGGEDGEEEGQEGHGGD